MTRKELIEKILKANPKFEHLEYQPIENLERIYNYYYEFKAQIVEGSLFEVREHEDRAG